MIKNIYSLHLSGLLYLCLCVIQAETKRISELPALESEPQLSRSSSFDSSEEILTPPQFDSSRTGLTTKLPCGRHCNKAHKRRRKQETRKKQPDPVMYKDSKRSSLTKNSTSASVVFPKKKRAKYSRKYDPTGMPEDNGFVPVPGPYGGKTTQRSAQRRARARNPDELLTKESRSNPNILGNGNFEILSGGIFSDDESNEIGEGRRVGRGYEGYGVSQFQRIPFNVQNFRFPSFYQGQLQVPTQTLFFPRAAY